MTTFQFLTHVFFWTGVVTFIIGAVTVVSPGFVLRTGERMNRWISTDKVFDHLDAPRATERFFYRHHRVFGLLLVIGAAFVLYSFGYAIDEAGMARQIRLFGSRAATDWFLHSLSALNILFSVVGVLMGVVIFFRPSLLKNLEQRANRWYGVDSSLKRLDVQMKAPDTLFRRRPRTLGVIIMLTSLYIVFSLHLLAHI